MSHVDTAILTFACSEAFVELDEGGYYELMRPINAWLEANAGGLSQTFGPDIGCLPEAFGGYKQLESPVFIAAFNYMPEADFIAFLRTLPWNRPQDVQYIVKRQHSDHFEIVS